MPAPKQPQDRKPKKDVLERELEQFTWERNGHKVTLPPPSKIKAGVIRRASKMDGDLNQIFSVIESIADEESLATIDDMEIDELNEMFIAWQAHGGASLGESQGSST